MTRIARVVVPDLPHHVVQRGNRRQQVFFSDDDRKAYLDSLIIYAKPAGIRIWSYCLMDNHLHLVTVPASEDSLARGLSEAHRRYTRYINFKHDWRGYLWEGRFKSYPLSEAHLYATMRYIERNPVRAGIVKNAWDYRWSSARAHVFNQKDPLLDDNFITADISDWKAFLSREDGQNDIKLVQLHTGSGRPLGDTQFIERIEELSGRSVRKQKTGPKSGLEFSTVSPE
ncbi:MAG: transposase [Candidatus Omnitrophota bacterium]